MVYHPIWRLHWKISQKLEWQKNLLKSFRCLVFRHPSFSKNWQLNIKTEKFIKQTLKLSSSTFGHLSFLPCISLYFNKKLKPKKTEMFIKQIFRPSLSDTCIIKSNDTFASKLCSVPRASLISARLMFEFKKGGATELFDFLLQCQDLCIYILRSVLLWFYF